MESKNILILMSFPFVSFWFDTVDIMWAQASASTLGLQLEHLLKHTLEKYPHIWQLMQIIREVVHSWLEY